MSPMQAVKKFVFGISWPAYLGVYLGAYLGTLSALSLLPQDRLMLDARNEYVLPIHFRTTNDAIHNIDTTGLLPLRIAGSAQFSEDELKCALEKIKTDFDCTVVDLREECHGFINGIAISWYAKNNAENFAKPLSFIENQEQERLQRLLGLKEVILHTAKPDAHSKAPTFDIQVKSAESEQQLCKRLGLGYRRFGVTDHLYPEIGVVDSFVAYVKTLKEPCWLYFHCRGGDGRTTTFMAMYDMMHNAKKLSFETIIRRQYLLGGHDLATIPKKLTWHSFRKDERLAFLKKFYDYCLESDVSFSKSYGQWLHK